MCIVVQTPSMAYLHCGANLCGRRLVIRSRTYADMQSSRVAKRVTHNWVVCCVAESRYVVLDLFAQPLRFVKGDWRGTGMGEEERQGATALTSRQQRLLDLLDRLPDSEQEVVVRSLEVRSLRIVQRAQPELQEPISLLPDDPQENDQVQQARGVDDP